MMRRTTKALNEAIMHVPRLRFANLPTPLEEARSLSEKLGGPRILFKRDDLTGLPQSGNKTRMFEFMLGEAISKRADVILATASVQSNYCRQLSVACARAGLETRLVLRNVRGNKDHEIQGNLLLALLAGARVKIVQSDVTERDAVLEKAKSELLEEGYSNVFVCRETPDHVATEAIAYIQAGAELAEQLSSRDIQANYLYTASLCTTQAGLLIANKYLDGGMQIVGVNPFGEQLPVEEAMIAVANKAANKLGIDSRLSANDIVSICDMAPGGYGVMTPEAREAIRLVAEIEGVFLDPIYTSRAMAALIRDIRNGRLTRKDTVVFLHTGGFPLLFLYGDQLQLDAALTVDDATPYIA